MSQKRRNPGVYKYYQVVVRTKQPVSDVLIEQMKLTMFRLFESVTMTDIISRKISKPHSLRWREGG